MLSLLNSIQSPFRPSTKQLFILVAIVITWVNLNHERWISKTVIDHDVVNYYSYLPAVFIEHDLSLSFLNDCKHKHQGERYWPNKTPNGNYVIKMSMGMSLSYLPFFFMAHIYAKLFNYEPYGFSEPYQFAILISSLFYFIIGLYFLQKILSNYFNNNIILFSIFCLCFGTNIFWTLTLGAGISHPVNFMLMAIFLHYTIHWKIDSSYKTSLLLGILIGLLTLIRPINILASLFFIFFHFNKLYQFHFNKNSIRPLLKHFIIIGFFALLVFSPQLIYWKYISNQFLFNSYVGEHFYFNNPHIIEGLFSFRKGWLVYTPMMLFSLIGLFFLKDKLKAFTIPIILFLVIYIYVCFSWWCWWYGGSFGQRALIDVYPFLAIPFAAFLQKLSHASKILRKSLYFIIFFFIFLNLLQTAQAKYNILHYDSMTRANYFEVFFTMTKKPDREKYLLHPNYEKALRGEDEYEY